MSKTMSRLGVIPSLLLGAALLAVGLLALDHIVNNWWPFNVDRLDLVRATALERAEAALLLDAANLEIVLAFLGSALVAVTGIVLPLAYILNRRFNRAPADKAETVAQPMFLVTLRQSMWVGLWVAFCIWLQMNRALGVAVAALVAAVLVMFEVLLQVRARAAHVTAVDPGGATQ
jgi:hypothetical protein